MKGVIFGFAALLGLSALAYSLVQGVVTLLGSGDYSSSGCVAVTSLMAIPFVYGLAKKAIK